MSAFSRVPGLFKLAASLAIGGALAGVIAWGAQGGAGDSGGSAPAAQVTGIATPRVPTPVVEGTEAPGRPFHPNYIPPDQAALSQVADDQAALASSGERCPASYLLYESQLLGGSFCYPPTWKVTIGDQPLLLSEKRLEGYRFALLLTKPDPVSGREVTRVAIQITGSRPFTLLDCPQMGTMQVDTLPAAVCFHERKRHPFNTITSDIARLIGVTIPYRLAEVPAVWAGVQLADQSPGDDAVDLVSQDQREALGIIASVRFKNP